MKNKAKKEIWKEFPLGYRSKFRYAISNFGRLISFEKDIKDGKILEGERGKHYKMSGFRFKKNDLVITKHLYHHLLVAIFFLKGKTEKKNCVIHLDHDKSNNRFDNLRWVTREEFNKHKVSNPGWIEGKRKQHERSRKKNSNLPHHLPQGPHSGQINFYPGEEWKEVSISEKLNFRYAISNYGRFMSFVENFKNGRILNPATIDGFKVYNLKVHKNGKVSSKYFFIRKLVAQNFLPPPAPDQTFVLYKDHNKDNNRVENLKWATKNEMYEHSKKSPHFIKAWRDRVHRGMGKKLTSTQVQLIKIKLLDPNRKTRMKMIAKQFGISETSLQRIKSGENWGHVKVRVGGKEQDTSSGLVRSK